MIAGLLAICEKTTFKFLMQKNMGEHSFKKIVYNFNYLLNAQKKLFNFLIHSYIFLMHYKNLALQNAQYF